MNGADLAKEAKNLVRSAAAKLAGKGERGRDRKVRRNSYDVDDSRAKVFSPIADGSKSGGLGFVDDVVRLAEEYDLTHRKPGERGPLMASGVRVLKIMLERFLDFRTGRLDPAIAKIAEVTGYTTKAVHAAITRLKAHGFINWVRRTRRTNNEGAGPQLEQFTNAYFFTLSALPKAVLQRWRDLRERRRRRLASGVTSAPIPQKPADKGLADALSRLRAKVEGANPQRDQYSL